MQLCDCRCFRRFLNYDASILVADALVHSQFNYCNSLFRSISKFNLHKLQCTQKRAVRIVSKTIRYTSINPIIKKLHWFSVVHCSPFKPATLFKEFLHTGFFRYFAPYLSSYGISYSTRDSQSGGNFLLSKFLLSNHKSVRQFG